MLQILAMIFSITGIVLFAYADGFGSPNMWGVVLAVTSASAAAVYKVSIQFILRSRGNDVGCHGGLVNIVIS